NEAVLVAFRPEETSFDELLRVFWEGHDPTQGMRQGNDVGSQYRSAIYWYDESQREAAEASRAAFQERLTAAGYGEITTEIAKAGPFYYAEDYHQQYLHKVPNGYCGLGLELDGGQRHRDQRLVQGHRVAVAAGPAR
ncbi:MAG TPA: peptide-methionine (S)-S-oxide reductase MsrA, partial [Actinomycetes bacterium]|nr:peptide-methionine (S)-S-oxide reductase MsrA [Actinomycetes bacterium]